MKSAIVRICALLALIACAPMAIANTHTQVVQEAYYALDPSASGYSSQVLNGDYVGDWNWIVSDLGAYSTVKNWFGCNASDWATTGDGSGCSPLAGWVSFYTTPSAYGYVNSLSPLANAYGRGGQCVYFVNLVLYRSGAYRNALPGLSYMWNYQDVNITNVQPGDVIQRYGYGSIGLTNHVAIAVQVNRNGDGSLASVVVVDSNWVSDIGANMEIIAKHTLSSSALAYFKVWNNY